MIISSSIASFLIVWIVSTMWLNPVITLVWCSISGCLIVSLVYLIKTRISCYKPFVPLVIMINVVILATMLTIPLLSVWEGQLLIWHTNDFAKASPLAIADDMQNIDDSSTS